MSRLLFILCLCTLSSAICPIGFFSSPEDDKCLFFAEKPRDYDNAVSYCNGMGGHVMSVSMECQHTQLRGVLGSKGYTSEVFLGATKINGDWEWDDRTEWNKTMWEGAPLHGNCLTMIGLDGSWSTTDCHRKLPYFCAIDETYGHLFARDNTDYVCEIAKEMKCHDGKPPKKPSTQPPKIVTAPFEPLEEKETTAVTRKATEQSPLLIEDPATEETVIPKAAPTKAPAKPVENNESQPEEIETTKSSNESPSVPEEASDPNDGATNPNESPDAREDRVETIEANRSQTTVSDRVWIAEQIAAFTKANPSPASEVHTTEGVKPVTPLPNTTEADLHVHEQSESQKEHKTSDIDDELNTEQMVKENKTGPACEDGWVHLEKTNQCYFFRIGNETTRVTHPSAFRKCKRRGGLLASIHTEEEVELLNDHLPTSHCAYSEGAWVGLGRDEKGKKWIDGSEFDYDVTCAHPEHYEQSKVNYAGIWPGSREAPDCECYRSNTKGNVMFRPQTTKLRDFVCKKAANN